MKKKKKKHTKRMIRKALSRIRGGVDEETDSQFPRDTMTRGRMPLMSRYTGIQSNSEAQRPMMVKHTESYGEKPARHHELLGRVKQAILKLRKKKHRVSSMS